MPETSKVPGGSISNLRFVLMLLRGLIFHPCCYQRRGMVMVWQTNSEAKIHHHDRLNNYRSKEYKIRKQRMPQSPKFIRVLWQQRFSAT